MCTETLVPSTGGDGIELGAMESGAATPQSPATPSVMPGAVISAEDFAQHVCGRGGEAESSRAEDGVMAGAMKSPTDRAVHRLQLLRAVSALTPVPDFAARLLPLPVSLLTAHDTAHA